MPEDAPPPTGEVTRDWCPKCEAEMDPLTARVVDTWCAVYCEDPAGPDDAAVQERLTDVSMRTCNGERHAVTQRAWWAFLHRKNKRRGGRSPP